MCLENACERYLKESSGFKCLLDIRGLTVWLELAHAVLSRAVRRSIKATSVVIGAEWKVCRTKIESVASGKKKSINKKLLMVYNKYGARRISALSSCNNLFYQHKI